MCSRQQTSIDYEAGGAGNFHTCPCLLSHRQYLFPVGLVDKTGFELCPRETTLLHQNVKTGLRGDVFNRIVNGGGGPVLALRIIRGHLLHPRVMVREQSVMLASEFCFAYAEGEKSGLWGIEIIPRIAAVAIMAASAYSIDS